MNIKFIDSDVEKPKHEQSIIYINICGDLRYPEILFGKVEYNWDDGDGMTMRYTEGDTVQDNFELTMNIDGWVIPRFLWSDLEDWHKQFDQYEKY